MGEAEGARAVRVPSGGARGRGPDATDGGELGGRYAHPGLQERDGVEPLLMGGAQEAQDGAVGESAVPGAVSAPDLAGNHGGADGLLGPPVGCVHARVVQEGEQSVSFVPQVLDKLAVLLDGGIPGEQAVGASLDAAADDAEAVVRELVAAVAE